MSSLDHLLQTRIENPVILSDYELRICREQLISEERALGLAEYQAAERGVDNGISGESLTVSAIPTARYRAHSANITALRNLLSPVRSLPVEILAEIFMLVYCSWEEANSEGETETELSEEKPMSARPPLLLTQICAAWTNVALQLPSLWTKLDLVVDDEEPEHFDHRALLTQWLRRAGNFPLEIRCRFKLTSSVIHGPKEIVAEIPARSIIRAIIPFLRQCRVFQLHARIASVQPLLQLNLHWPQLEILDLNITDVPQRPLLLGSSPSSYTRTPLETFFRAPRLRSIAIGGTISNILMLPTRRITSLALRGHIVLEVMNNGNPQHFINMMVHCPNITHLSISASFGRGRFNWTGMIFKRLRSLEVVYELDDIDIDSTDKDLTPSFLYFLVRSNAMPALSSFSLVGKSTRAASLEACVRERFAQGKSCDRDQGEPFHDVVIVGDQARFMIEMTRNLFRGLRRGLEQSIATTRWRASWPDGNKVRVQSNITFVEFHGVFWLSHELFVDIVKTFPQIEKFHFDDTLNRTYSVDEEEVSQVLAGGEDGANWLGLDSTGVKRFGTNVDPTSSGPVGSV